MLLRSPWSKFSSKILSAFLMLSEVVNKTVFSPLSPSVVHEGFPASDSPKSGLLLTITVGGVRAKVSSKFIALVVLFTTQFYPYVNNSQNRSRYFGWSRA